ncbi:MAG: hydrogenase nickel incorporation protein HypB [Ignavibacteriales bacterium]|nr:hydrogenase nickel incorporation protein HypB [Ignavibacteriales bacterium]
MTVIKIERKILEKNDAIAGDLKKYFNDRNIFVINLLSSPGSGKTSIIERTIINSRYDFNIAVIVGDVQTDNDAKRVAELKTPVVQIITNGACHLEANLIRDAVNNLKQKIDLLFIENVGNLVCPAGFNLGEDIKVIVASTTEGDDKPLKYPVAYRNSEALIINKIDLCPHLNSNVDILRKNALLINPKLKVFETSCTTDEGITKWIDWLKLNLKKK